MRLERGTLAGPILIVLGAILLFKGGVHFGPDSIFEHFWPTLFVIPLGVFFHWMYFFMLQRRGIGLLVPGGILLTVGITCQISALFDAWSYMWPGFILAPAAGLFELYWFGSRNKWLLIPINILTAMAALFLAVFSVGHFFESLLNGRPLVAAGLIVGGTLLMVLRRSPDAVH